MWRNRSRAIGPDDDCIENGTKLLCEIYAGYSRRGGEMRDEVDNVRWQYRRNNAAVRWRLRHPLKRPDFFVTELNTKDEVIIRRASYIPSVFYIIEGGRTVGTIRMLRILRNKYSISIDGVKTWTVTCRCSPFLLRKVKGRDGNLGSHWSVRKAVEHPHQARSRSAAISGCSRLHP